MPDYNPIVWIYDLLTRIVFGKKLEHAKAAKLEYIKPGDRVLIVGGGSGSILDYLCKLDFPLEVDYVDISRKMIRRARKRNCDKLKVHFFQQSILDFREGRYNIIITDFFFDQFQQELAQKMAYNLANRLNPGGLLLFSDFITSAHWRDKAVLKLMIWFLKVTASLKISQLPDYRPIFAKAGFSSIYDEMARPNIQLAVYTAG